MKKMKLLTAIISVAALTVVSVGSVLAGGMSAYKKAPALTTNSIIATDTVNCKTGANTVTGPNTWSYFTSFGELDKKLEANSNRTLTIRLMELDQHPNADDPVKEYKGRFNGRTLSSITYVKTLDIGNIDSEGDNVAELYLEIKIGSCTTDKTRAVSSGLFSYKYGIN